MRIILRVLVGLHDEINCPDLPQGGMGGSE